MQTMKIMVMKKVSSTQKTSVMMEMRLRLTLEDLSMKMGTILTHLASKKTSLKLTVHSQVTPSSVTQFRMVQLQT